MLRSIVQGIGIVGLVPFTGESILWKMRPNHFQLVVPRADIYMWSFSTASEDTAPAYSCKKIKSSADKLRI